jgi:GAF domain-containing protein
MVSLAILDRVTFHVPDAADLSETEYPDTVRNTRNSGTRTMLVVPLIRDEVALGSILIRRTEVRPFTDKQVALLETFADQAVIAIENTRLFQELQDRNRELDLALEQQTATGEVLRVIASSPTDLQTVLDTVAENAARLCGAVNAAIRRADGGVLRRVASYGWQPPTEEVPTYAPHRRSCRGERLRPLGFGCRRGTNAPGNTAPS